MKQTAMEWEGKVKTSPPMRGRGLKQREKAGLSGVRVAPYAGAWIETGPHLPHPWPDCVAPYAGAWIETSTDSNFAAFDGRPLCGGVD